MTFRIKASMLLGIIVAAALSISGYYYINFFENSIRNSIFKGLESVGAATSQEIARFLNDSLNETQAVAQAFPTKAIEQKNAQVMDEFLKSYMAIFPKFRNGMFVLDKDGILWSDYPKHPNVRGKSFAFRQYYQETMAHQKGIVGVPYRSARTGEPVATFTAIIRDSAGQVAGMLGCSVKLTSPDALEGTRLVKIGQSGYLYVFNTDRLLILHPQEDRILTSDVSPGLNRMYDAAIQGFEGTGETVNSRGIPMLINMSHIPNTNWILGVQQPKSEAFAPIKSVRTRILWGILLVAFVSVAIGAFLMSNITRPLKRLQEVIVSMEIMGQEDFLADRSNYKKQLDAIQAKGEIGDLKNAFKSLSEKLDVTMRSFRNLALDWENTFNSVLDVIFLLDKENNIVRLNRAAKQLLEKSDQELQGKPIFDFLDIPPIRLRPAGSGETEKDQSFNLRFKGERVYEIFQNEIVDDNNDVAGKVLIGRDITFRLEAMEEKLRLENKLQQAHKMEAIGTLAGGVAHDLNNILSGIVSYPELLLLQTPKNSPMVKPLETILKSGKKAAAIVQDLLALARRGIETYDVVNLNDIVKEYMHSPEHHQMKTYHPDVVETIDLADDLLDIEGSSVHLSKVIMNLVSNAAEAMPDGGTVHIATENRYIDAQSIDNEEMGEGEYVVFSIADEGVGLSDDDLNQIFEPFFTKKKMGRSGTGLGMAVVWGTIKDHKGFIDVKSTVGSGTRIQICLPATRKKRRIDVDALKIEQFYGHGESILVVDDVEEQREIATSILLQLGYRVQSVASGEEALAFLKNNAVDLLILDMIMFPGIDGFETFKGAIELNPSQKAIIASGYSETHLVRKALALGSSRFVQKPYTIPEIGKVILNVLSDKGA